VRLLKYISSPINYGLKAEPEKNIIYFGAASMKMTKDANGAIEIWDANGSITVSPYMIEAFIETMNSLYVIDEAEIEIDVIDFKRPDLHVVE
jgi:hypothetical protein